MLVMPAPQLVPDAVWEIAETKEMEQVIGLYGKTYHLWHTDRGDTVPRTTIDDELHESGADWHGEVPVDRERFAVQSR